MSNQTNNIIILQGQAELAQGIHYEVDSNEPPLGEGGTGIVRHGVRVDDRTGKRSDVAIKFLFNDLSRNVIQRSKREAQIHIVHENLVEMLGFVEIVGSDMYGKDNVHYNVVSELLRGVMLLDMLTGDVPEDLNEKYPKVAEHYQQLQNDRQGFALFIVRSVLSGVMALHDNGYIHRDIDPSNIMLTADGKVKIIDLGICKRLNNMSTGNENLTSVGQFVGKAAYAAPELVRGDLNYQNATTDIYAIGIMLYQIITGSLPFTGSMNEILEKQISEKIPVNNIPDKNIRKLVKKATQKHQSERYQTAAEFRVAIDQLSQAPASGAPAKPKPVKAPKSGGSGFANKINSMPLWPVAAGIAAVGAITGAVLGFII